MTKYTIQKNIVFTIKTANMDFLVMKLSIYDRSIIVIIVSLGTLLTPEKKEFFEYSSHIM